MRFSNSSKAVLPQVGVFNPLTKNHPPKTNRVQKRPSERTSAAIGKGGMVLAVSGVSPATPLVVEAEVSMVGRTSSGPLIVPVGEGESDEDDVPARQSSQSSGRFLGRVLGASLLANVALLAACAHQQISLNPTNETTASVGRNVSSSAEQASVKSDRLADNKNVQVVRKSRPAESEPVLEEKGASRQDKATQKTVSKSRKSETSEATSDIAARSAPDDKASPTASARAASFIEKLQRVEAGTRTEPVTIVHIGDSHVASDSFTRGIRTGLQARFGDAGRGAIVPASAFKYAQADGVRMNTKGSWKAKNSLKDKSGPYGLSGVSVTSASQAASMNLTVTGAPFDWAEVTVLTGPRQGRVTLIAGDHKKTFNASSSTRGSKVFRINAKAKNLTVKPAGGGKTTVLNWASGRESAGIRYVNFGIISATAFLTKRWDPTLVSNDIKHLNPDLIVFGFGTNEGFNDNLNLQSYKTHVQSFVATVSAAAPQSDWLFLGPASGARRVGKSAQTCNGWRVPPKLAGVRQTLSDIAKQNRALYWDWSEAMGGPCGIDRWARSNPKLAAGDRVHLTSKGYGKSARSLVAHISKLVDKPQIVALNDRQQTLGAE